MEAGALFANRLSEEVFVALGETRRRGCFALYCLCPARAVGENAVGMELGGDGGAGDGESIDEWGAGVGGGGSVGVADGHSSTIGTITGRRGVAKLVDAGDDAAQRVVAGAGNGEPDLSGVVGLPCSDLTAEGIILVASRKPRDVGHVERDKAR